jgi:hypothetical protein
MMELLEAVDPAKDLNVNSLELKALVEEKVGLSVRMTPQRSRPWKAWSVAAAAFVVVMVAVPPLFFRSDPINPFETTAGSSVGIAGIDRSIPLASGGVQTMDVDGDTIWVVSALARTLQKVSASLGTVEGSFQIDGHVEGVTVGGRYIWMNSYDNGGEVLRFDPDAGKVDLTIPINGPPGFSSWFGGRLWVSNQNGDLFELSADGEVLSVGRGDVKGAGLGYLWINDPDSGLIKSISEDGTVGEVVIPTVEGVDTMAGFGVRKVTDAGGYLWLMDGDFPWGTNLSRFDLATGEFRSMGGYTFGLLDMLEFRGSLWVVSNTDNLLLRIDPESGEAVRFAVPGKIGGLAVLGDHMWATFYQPGGSLARFGVQQELLVAGNTVFDDWNRFPHRLLCTGNADSYAATIVLEPSAWIGYGSWSVVQAKLSAQGLVVCANGYVEGSATSVSAAAADLADALAASGLPGPFVLVSAVDGVHTLRSFASGRTDIGGVVMVDPMPVGFPSLYDSLVPDWGHPPWLDIDPTESGAFGDLSDIPLTVIGQDPTAMFLSKGFVAGVGRKTAEAMNVYWQTGLASYAALSSDSSSLVSTSTGFDSILAYNPDLVVAAILEMLGGGQS